MADLTVDEASEVVIIDSDGVNELDIDIDGRLGINTSDINDARAGCLYLANTTFISIATGAERDFILLKNPSGSGKVVNIHEIVMTVDENIGATYRFKLYLNPTITSNGTSITPVNARQVGTVAVSSTVYYTPTISTRGTLVYVSSWTLSSPTLRFVRLLLDPDNNYLLTVTVDNTTNINGCLIFSEQIGI